MFRLLVFTVAIHISVFSSVTFGDVSPLRTAIETGELSKVRMLIEKDKGIINEFIHDSRADKSSPLMIACKNGALEIAKYLLDSGADPNLQRNGGPLPIIFAANKGSKEIVELLIVSGADVDGRTTTGATALVNAAALGRLEIAKVLLEHGADQTLSMSTGSPATPIGKDLTPMKLAAEGGYKEIVELLMKYSQVASTDDVGEVIRKSKEAKDYATGNLIRLSPMALSITIKGTQFFYPVQDNTKFHNERGLPISVKTFQVGNVVTIALYKNLLVEVRKGMWKDRR